MWCDIIHYNKQIWLKRNEKKTNKKEKLPYFLPIAGLVVIEPIVATKTMIENNIAIFEAIALVLINFFF